MVEFVFLTFNLGFLFLRFYWRGGGGISWKQLLIWMVLMILGFFYELPNEESVLYAFKSDKAVSIDVL